MHQLVLECFSRYQTYLQNEISIVDLTAWKHGMIPSGFALNGMLRYDDNCGLFGAKCKSTKNLLMALSCWPRAHTSTWRYRQIQSQQYGTMDFCQVYGGRSISSTSSFHKQYSWSSLYTQYNQFKNLPGPIIIFFCVRQSWERFSPTVKNVENKTARPFPISVVAPSQWSALCSRNTRALV